VGALLEPGADVGQRTERTAELGSLAPAWTDRVAIDRTRGTATIPPNIRLDFGGIAKGAFVDRLVELLGAWPGGYVDAGGDVRVWGRPPRGECWTASIEDPLRPERTLARLPIAGPEMAAVATSGTYRRRWRAKDREAHHLIDPATGEPLRNAPLSVSVFAARAVDAEIAGKSLIVAAARGMLLDLAPGTIAVICGKDGSYATLATTGRDPAETAIDSARPAA
jgi:thiamine biosynthesis lipoprotein